MGLGFPFGSARRAGTACVDATYTPPAPEPNPRNFEIVSMSGNDDYTIAVIRYPACTTFGGRKLCLYQCGPEVLSSQTFLDPHFQETGISPIARFEPTQNGLDLANQLFFDLTGADPID